MAEFEDRLLKFEVSLKKTLETLKSLQAENQTLKEKNHELTLLIESQKNLTKDIEENEKNLKLAETMSQSGVGYSELRTELDDYVKEIDRCIALLNE